MAQCNVPTLLAQASCFNCYGPGVWPLLRLAVLARILKARSPSADTSPQALLAQASCFRCYSVGTLMLLKLALLCRIVNGSGTPVPPVNPCIPPSIGDLGAVAASGAVNFNLSIPLPPNPPTVGYIFRWGTTPGGPYPNSKELPVAGPFKLTVGDGLVVGTTYYFIAFGDNGNGCLSVASNESSAAPTP